MGSMHSRVKFQSPRGDSAVATDTFVELLEKYAPAHVSISSRRFGRRDSRVWASRLLDQEVFQSPRGDSAVATGRMMKKRLRNKFGFNLLAEIRPSRHISSVALHHLRDVFQSPRGDSAVAT